VSKTAKLIDRRDYFAQRQREVAEARADDALLTNIAFGAVDSPRGA
jgi:hypothetical protein